MSSVAPPPAPPSTSEDDIIYLYNGSDVVPKRVHHVRVDPSVTVATIPDDAFAKCRFLRNIELPEGLQVIRNGAFRYCIQLKRITIPSTVIEIGEDASNWRMLSFLEDFKHWENVPSVNAVLWRQYVFLHSSKQLKRVYSRIAHGCGMSSYRQE